METFFKKLVTQILIWEARTVLKKHKPRIIGVTGSVGKSSAKEAIFAVLARRYNVRKSIKSYNSELGVSLAILGLETAWSSPMGWIKNILRGLHEVFNLPTGKAGKQFPEVLVLEMGADRPRDLDKLLAISKPEIAVVTAIGDIPAHVEFFAGPEEIAKEKAKILKTLSATGYALLNFDDAVIWGMRESTKAHVISFGFGEGAEIRALNEKISNDGVSFKISYQGSLVPCRMRNVLGKQYIYAALAAAAVGITFDINLIEVSEALSIYKPLPGRMNLLSGIKQSLILDDSYNASPLATDAALDTLKDLEAMRKIVALGDMLELGKYTIEAHRAIGKKIAKVADCFIAVGPRSKFAADEAIVQGMNPENVINFSTTLEAAAHIKGIIKEGDVILVKGSQAMRMEKIVEEIMADPQSAKSLLARQDKYWKNKE